MDSLFLLTFLHTHAVTESLHSVCCAHLTPFQPIFCSSHCCRGLGHSPPAAPPPRSQAALGFLYHYEVGHPWVPSQYLCLGKPADARKLTPHREILNQWGREAGGLVTPLPRQTVLKHFLCAPHKGRVR